MSQKENLTLNSQGTGDIARRFDPLTSEAEKLSRCSSSEARAFLSYESACYYKVLPLGYTEISGSPTLTLVTNDDSNQQSMRELRFICGTEIRLLRTEEKDLLAAIVYAYKGSEEELERKRESLERYDNIKCQSAKTDRPIRRAQGAVPDFIESLLIYALDRNASDIHLLPRHDGLYVALRVDGELRTHQSAICSLAAYKQIVSRLKILASLDITKVNGPLDGSFKFEAESLKADIRISTMPTLHGEKVVLRLHGCRSLIEINRLGFNASALETIDSALKHKSGLIICCGPTGSGKSSTLYSMLKAISTLNRSIVTIEDPVEMQLQFADQTSIEVKNGLTYARCLKAALRQDPDCIMIGELRDAESAKMTFEAAFTGHLVLTSLHAGCQSEVIGRLNALGITKNEFEQTHCLVIAQRLLSMLCCHCKVFNLNATRDYGHTVYRNVGCSLCDYSGYKGRVLLHEIGWISPLREPKESFSEYAETLLKRGDIDYDQYLDTLCISND